MPKVTIEDISQRTGLSRGTISRALNDRPDISAQTKARVLEACTALNFIPSHAARSLATGRYYALAVIVDDLQSTFAAGYIRGVMGRAERMHYSTIVVELPRDAKNAADRMQVVGTERLDGVLLAVPLDDSLSEIVRETAPDRVIASCWPISGLACDLVGPDMAESGRLAAQHALSAAGRVLYLDRATEQAARERRAGFETACRERGVTGDVVVDIQHARGNGSPDFEPVRAALLNAQAVVASDDDLAIAAMIWLGAHGRKVGTDVAVIGQGNDLTGQRIAPLLSTVDFAGEEIGRRAADVVLQRVSKSRQDVPETARVAPQLLRRDSSACLP